MRCAAALAFVLLAGCAKQEASKPFTPIVRAENPAGYREVQLDADHRLWVYAPKGAAKKKLPCVFIAPAGAHMQDGMSLGEGDIDEQMPYVKAGYIVVAYDVSGELKGKGEADIVSAVKAFTEADAGVADGKRALDYALENLNIDPNRIVSAGHSSAATIALALAENDSRVKACLAYAPVVDVEARLGADSLAVLDQAAPGSKEKLIRFSPVGGKADLRCPTLIFHAKDDANVHEEPLSSFAHSIPNVKFVEVPSGGHYDSMIAEGIPAGIAFLKSKGIAP